MDRRRCCRCSSGVILMGGILALPHGQPTRVQQRGAPHVDAGARRSMWARLVMLLYFFADLSSWRLPVVSAGGETSRHRSVGATIRGVAGLCAHVRRAGSSSRRDARRVARRDRSRGQWDCVLAVASVMVPLLSGAAPPSSDRRLPRPPRSACRSLHPCPPPLTYLLGIGGVS